MCYISTIKIPLCVSLPEDAPLEPKHVDSISCNNNLIIHKLSSSSYSCNYTANCKTRIMNNTKFIILGIYVFSYVTPLMLLKS
jgi:hypothetical protein